MLIKSLTDGRFWRKTSIFAQSGKKPKNFGVNRELGLGVWNDAHALGKVLARFPQTVRVRAVAAELSALAPEMAFAAPPQGLDRLRLWLYGCSLRLQMALRGRNHRKYAQLERRLRTVRGTYVDEPNAVFFPVGGRLHRRI